MNRQIDPDRPIEGTYVFDGRLCRKGYALNKLGASLRSEAAREDFKADPEAAMERIGLSEAQKRLIRDRDWLGCVKAGCNIYFLYKITACFGDSLYRLGAQQLGISYEEFLETRDVGGAT